MYIVEYSMYMYKHNHAYNATVMCTCMDMHIHKSQEENHSNHFLIRHNYPKSLYLAFRENLGLVL